MNKHLGKNEGREVEPKIFSDDRVEIEESLNSRPGLSLSVTDTILPWLDEDERSRNVVLLDFDADRIFDGDVPFVVETVSGLAG